MNSDVPGKSAAEQIDDIITLYGGWKGALLSRIRTMIKTADPAVTEAVKWRMKSRPEGLPVWYHEGIMCRTEAFKDNLKLVFSKGAQMQDPGRLFNARLHASSDRAIEFHEGDEVSEAGVQALVREAVALNAAKKRG
ncbi:MAG TPA: DUF1801 domain-containing protein [Candidatus Saccharimonadales bacterium]|nr:DUF1801 domain-containing protein [Candidatus Saccharimonadales bacterium]